MGVAADQAAGPAGAGAAAPAPAATNFDWTTSVEPHAARRRAILAKYGPQVRALYGTDAWTGVQVCWVEGGEEGGSWDGGVSVCQPGGTKDRNVRAAPFFFFSFVSRGSTAPPRPAHAASTTLPLPILLGGRSGWAWGRKKGGLPGRGRPRIGHPRPTGVCRRGNGREGRARGGGARRGRPRRRCLVGGTTARAPVPSLGPPARRSGA